MNADDELFPSSRQKEDVCNLLLCFWKESIHASMTMDTKKKRNHKLERKRREKRHEREMAGSDEPLGGSSTSILVRSLTLLGNLMKAGAHTQSNARYELVRSVHERPLHGCQNQYKHTRTKRG